MKTHPVFWKEFIKCLNSRNMWDMVNYVPSIMSFQIQLLLFLFNFILVYFTLSVQWPWWPSVKVPKDNKSTIKVVHKIFELYSILLFNMFVVVFWSNSTFVLFRKQHTVLNDMSKSYNNLFSFSFGSSYLQALPAVFKIEMRHGNFTWLIKRKEKHFMELHRELRTYKTFLRIPLPSRRWLIFI